MVSTVSLAVDQTCNECHGELGTLATGGLHPQPLLGNTCDKPYLSSVHSEALHACHTLPPNDDLTSVFLGDHMTVCQDFKYDHNLYKGYFTGKVAQIRQIFEDFYKKSLDFRFYNK
jgi:hypothetical protein